MERLRIGSARDSRNGLCRWMVRGAAVAAQEATHRPFPQTSAIVESRSS
jgi:hypothetical protein